MTTPVIVSYCNNGYKDFAENLLLNLNKILKNHMVHFYCLDENIYKSLLTLKLRDIIQLELVSEFNVSDQFQPYGYAEYNAITHTKMYILKRALLKYNFVHFVDCDVVCVREPDYEFYERYKTYDAVFQYDCGMYSRTELHHPLFTNWCCTGNFSIRGTPGGYFLIEKIIEYQRRFPYKNDQECLKIYLDEIGVADIRMYEKASLFVYPVEEYTNGYWLKNDIGTLEKTFFFHANHVVGKEAKISLLKKAGLYN